MANVRYLPLLLIPVLYVVLVRTPYRGMLAVDWDETIYWTIAAEIPHGKLPYRDLWDNKPPGMHFLFAPLIALCGRDVAPLRDFTTIWLCANAFLLYLIGRRYSEPVGFIAALLYAVYSSDVGVTGPASQYEHFVLLPVLVASWIVGEKGPEHLVWPMLAGGLAAYAVLVKQVAAFYLAALAVLIVSRRRGRSEPAARFRLMLWYAVGAALPMAVVSGYFLAAGAFDDLWGAVVGAAVRYGSRPTLAERLSSAATSLAAVFRTEWMLYVLPFACLLRTGGGERRVLRDWSILLASSCLAVASTGRFLPHYYLLPQPWLCLLAGSGLASLFSWAVGKTRPAIAWLVVIAIAGLGCAGALDHRKALALYRTKHQQDAGAQEAAAYLRAHSQPDDTIYVLYGQPIVYFLSERSAPTRYFWYLHLLDPFNRMLPDPPGRIVRQIETARPRYFVVGPKTERGRIAELDAFVAEHYRPARGLGGYVVYERGAYRSDAGDAK